MFCGRDRKGALRMADKVDTSKKDVFVYIYDAADDEDEAYNRNLIRSRALHNIHRHLPGQGVLY